MDVKALGEQTAPAAGTTPAQGSPPADAAPAVESKPTRPEWLPESYFDAEKGAIKDEDFGKHYAELATGAKAEQERIAAYPQKLEDLKFELPADLKLPEGMKLDESNPTFQAFRQFAFEKKLDPAVGSQLLGMYVKEQATNVEAINKRVGEEMQKLGANGAARISSLRTFLDSKVGPELSKSVMAGVFTADQVNGMEKLMLAMSNGGTAVAPGTAREAPKNEISDEEYEAMSPRQKLEYARSKPGANRS